MYYTHETRQCPPYSHACNELMLRLAGMQNQCNLLRIIGAQNVRHAPLLWASVCVRCAHGVGPQHSATGRPRPPITRAPFPGSCSRRVPSVCACLCPRTSTRTLACIKRPRGRERRWAVSKRERDEGLFKKDREARRKREEDWSCVSCLSHRCSVSLSNKRLGSLSLPFPIEPN